MNQNAQILAHLKQYAGITAREAVKRYGIYRLASRIWDLKMDGYKIEKTLMFDTRLKKRWAYYCL